MCLAGVSPVFSLTPCCHLDCHPAMSGSIAGLGRVRIEGTRAAHNKTPNCLLSINTTHNIIHLSMNTVQTAFHVAMHEYT